MDIEEVQRQRREKVKAENELAERRELEARKDSYFLREAVGLEDSVARKLEDRRKLEEAMLAKDQQEREKKETKKFAQSKETLRKHDEAMSLLASNPNKAMELLRELAELKHLAASCFALGEYLMLHSDDTDEALKYMRAAADQDFPKASTATGYLLAVKRHHAEAKRYFEKAAKLGDQDAIEELRKPEYQSNEALQVPPRPQYWWDRQPELRFNAAKSENTGNSL